MRIPKKIRSLRNHEEKKKIRVKLSGGRKKEKEEEEVVYIHDLKTC